MTRQPPISAHVASQWARMWTQSSFLMADAALVMALRSWRMMLGGSAARDEGERMVGEKVGAGFELVGALASGRVRTPEAAARKTLDIYGKRVRANRRRLG